jgi:hypothetical protein
MTEFNNPIFNWDMGLSKIGILGFHDFLALFLIFFTPILSTLTEFVTKLNKS